MNPSTTALTPSEETFCRTMAVGASSVTAARVAGIRPDLAATIGAALCGRTEIQNRIGVLFSEREAEHAARLRRTVEQLDRIHDAAIEKGQFGVAYKAITQIFRLLDGETRRLQRGFEELRHPAFAAAFPADILADVPPEPPQAPGPGPHPVPSPRAAQPQSVAPLPDLSLLPAEVRRIIEAELGLAPAAPPPPAGSPLTALGTVLAGPGRAGPKPG